MDTPGHADREREQIEELRQGIEFSVRKLTTQLLNALDLAKEYMEKFRTAHLELEEWHTNFRNTDPDEALKVQKEQEQSLLKRINILQSMLETTRSPT